MSFFSFFKTRFSVPSVSGFIYFFSGVSIFLFAFLCTLG